MAWMRALAGTYDVFADEAGVEHNGQPVLLPISHSTFNAQIEVTIDREGNFRRSQKLEKGKDVVTIIPVTEDSAARSSGITPHPLCDKLCYLAGDYTAYTGDDKEAYFAAYMEQLRDWAEAEESHPSVQAVYRYLGKKTLIGDLVRDKTLELDEDNRLTDRLKIQTTGQTGANVRFLISGSEIPEVWKDPGLYGQFISYYRKKAGEKKLCYASGQLEACSDKHPSKIRNTADKAKLISGNDDVGFTYRGRFLEKDQAVSVSYELSQKAHNALRWLIQKQGYTRDESAIVCWMMNRDMQIPDITKDSANAYNAIDDFEMDWDCLDELVEEIQDKRETGKYFAEQFNNAVRGYAGKIEIDDHVAIIALEAATTGRLSIVYYDEMGARQYMDAILDWQEHCRWMRHVKAGKNERGITCECSPSPRDMALAAFGVQRAKWLEADSRLLRATVKRLLPCITRKERRIPQDLVKAAARRASMPETMDSFVWYNEVLRVACAMIRYNYEKEGKAMDHFLKDNLEDRNVLFGRLLAVFDYMEQRAMYEPGEREQRTTNAKRYWNAYSSRPAKTAKTIRQNLVAYEKKLNGYQLSKFEEWIEEIMKHFAAGDYDNRALSELYLPGYYLQMDYMKEALYTKKEQ